MRRASLLALGLTLLLLPLTAQNLTSGLVFYAPFDGNTVNLVDWVKPVNTGAGLTVNKFGEANKAIYFDGENDLLDYGNILSLGRSSFTISVWVKSASNGSNARILSKGMAAIGPNGYQGFAIKTIKTHSGTFNFRLTIADGEHVYQPAGIESPVKPETSGENWCHLIIIRSGNKTEHYLNGELLKAATADRTMEFNTDEPFTVGGLLPGDGWAAQDLFAGVLDELRVYNRRLNESDIAALYQQFLGKDAELKTIELSVYPNPTTRILKADFKKAADRRIEIVDAAGRNMFYGRFSDQRAELNVSGLPPGIYFLRIREGERVVMRKFVKQGAVLP